MTALVPFSLTSPVLLIVAALAAIVASATVLLRKPGLSGTALVLEALGAAMLCLAAGGPIWNKPTAGEVAILVDLSPSTRTADYRNREQLQRRVHSLLGNTPMHFYYFASTLTSVAPGGATLPDLPAEQTLFTPPAGAAAVVLFSDARFELPARSPPVYVVLDPALESPNDAAVHTLQVRQYGAVINTSNSGPARAMTLTGTSGLSSATVPPGSIVLTRAIDPAAVSVSARIAPGDAWPENDQLTAIAPPADHHERWWVGGGNPGPGWRVMSAAQLPGEPAAYLAPTVIVLQDIAADELDPLRQRRLEQYVRDLGGGLILLGGAHAFAAGGYPGSTLEHLSPLASTPPEPTTHWIILADSSGSMAQVQGGFSLWHYASDAALKVLGELPPEDRVTIGSFAQSLSWWSSDKTARDTLALHLPPPEIGPHGPTNLEQALSDVARSATGDLPAPLLLITDADAQIDDPAGLAAALKQKHIRLHLLAIGEGSSLPALKIIIGATGGTLIRQFDPHQWTAAVRQLMRAAAPRLLGREPLTVTFQNGLASLPARNVFPWNRTWIKKSADSLALGAAADGPAVLGARWNVREGRVLALAFDAGPGAADALARAAERKPGDPRFAVTWETGARLHVALSAVDSKTYLNSLHVRLELSPAAENTTEPHSFDLTQTGPGRYELDMPALRAPSFAAVRVEGHVADRIAIAGRYAPEFDTIGNDHDAMRKLSRRTGGQVIAPRQVWPIDFRWPRQPVPLMPWLAAAGAILVASGLAVWKLGRPM